MQAGHFLHYALLFLRLQKHRRDNRRYQRFVDMIGRVRVAFLLMLSSLLSVPSGMC